MNMEALVQIIMEEVRRVLAEQRPQRLLVVVTGAPAVTDEMVADLEQIIASGRFRPTLLLSKTAARHPSRSRFEQALGVPAVTEGEGAPAAPELAFAADRVLVPWLSLNTAARLAAGTCDTLATSALMMSLLRGIPMIACGDEFDPDGPYLSGWARPAPALAGLLRSYRQCLGSYGVQLTSSAGLAAVLLGGGTPPSAPAVAPQPAATGKKPVITQADVELAAASGDLSRLPADAIWTPLAREALLRAKR